MRYYSLALEHRFAEKIVAEAERNGFKEVEKELRRICLALIELEIGSRVSQSLLPLSAIDTSLILIPMALQSFINFDTDRKFTQADEKIAEVEKRYVEFAREFESSILNLSQAILSESEKYKSSDNQVAATFKKLRAEFYSFGFGHFFDHVTRRYSYITYWLNYSPQKKI